MQSCKKITNRYKIEATKYMIQDLRFKVQYNIANVIEGKNKASEYTVFQNSTSM